MTLPATVYDLPNLKADREAKGEPCEPLYRCPCGRVVPAEGLLDTAGLDCDMPRWVCPDCASGPYRVAKAAEEAEAAAAAALSDPWDTEDGRQARARRDAELAAYLWTILPGSPLTDENRALWRQWRVVMNRVTMDHATPALALESWPDRPAYDYTPLSLQT